MKLLCVVSICGQVRRQLGAVVVLGVAALMLSTVGWAQSLTTGALAGLVTDPSGAAIPAAKVTATSLTTGVAHSTESQANGHYLLPLLEPGQYTITVEKTGFQTAKQSGVGISVSTTGALDFKLAVGAATQTVEVTGLPPLIQPQNANTTTTLDSKAIENVPNPGGDITYLAQVSPGAVMDVHGGGGTAGLTLNGIQGGTIEYTYDGMDDNDPFNNDNNSGPTNMLLGSNSVSEVTVNTNSYAVDQGRMSAGQINYLSKSGGNDFHGDAQWQWNGRSLNAYDFFVKAQTLAPGQSLAPKPFDNVNNWAGGVGGPIVKNKLFFFFDSEGARIDLPNVINFSVPTQAFENYSAQELLLGGYDTNSSSSVMSGNQFRYVAPPTGSALSSAQAFMNNFFKLYGNTNVGTSGGVQISPNTAALTGCNILANGTVDQTYNPQVQPTGFAGSPNAGTNAIPSDTGCANTAVFTGSANTPETLTSIRIDYTLNQNNTIWGKYLDDQGTQTTGINPVNAVFDENSFQPDHQGVLDWTHVFTPTLTNDASTGFLWYSAIFDFDTPAAEHAAIDGLGSIGSPFTTLGSTNFPQGRNVTQYQAIDNLTWTRGSHSFKFGENFRRELVNDHDFARSFASTNTSNYSEFMFDAASSASQRYPISNVEQFKDFSLDLYAGDTWQVSPTVTFTYGIRATQNSNPVDATLVGGQSLIANWSDFETFAHPNINNGNANAALNTFMLPSSVLWNSLPTEVWQPRLSLAWQPHPNTLVKAGWGMFSQVATASAAETLAGNAPFDPSFNGGFGSGDLGAYGSGAGCVFPTNTSPSPGSSPQCGYLWAPGAGSAVAAAVAGNAQLQGNFSGGAQACAPGTVALTCISPPNISALPAGGLKAPMAYEYNLTVQQQVGRTFSISLGYVGNRSQHNSYTVDDNGFETACQFCFSPFLFATTTAGAPDPRFGTYSQTRYDGYARYDAMQATLTERQWHGLTLNLNYAWSHCLSTGTPFGDGAADNLAATYATCSADINQNATASYTYALPFRTSNGFLGKFVNGWQASGATFSEGGTPIFPSINGVTNELVNTTGPHNGVILSNVPAYAKDQFLPTSVAGRVQWLNPNAFAGSWDPNNRACVDVQTTALTEIKPSAAGASAICQFDGNVGAYLRGPTFQWTNFDLAKNIQVTERVALRLDFQGFNVFNHANFSNPSTTAVAGESAKAQSGANEITSLVSPVNGLLGDGNGGDSNPRMLAFQAKINF